MAEQIQAGDMVQLKSGGDIMTVDRLTPTGLAVCQWFVNHELKSGSFSLASLKRAN